MGDLSDFEDIQHKQLLRLKHSLGHHADSAKMEEVGRLVTGLQSAGNRCSLAAVLHNIADLSESALLLAEGIEHLEGQERGDVVRDEARLLVTAASVLVEERLHECGCPRPTGQINTAAIKRAFTDPGFQSCKRKETQQAMYSCISDKLKKADLTPSGS